MNAGYKSRQTIAIIGGGVIGLSIGWRIAQAGVQVDIFERDKAGQAASWAAAGMLAAASEVEPGESALFALSHRSQELWPDFAAEIAAASGIDVQLRTEGTLSIALNPDDLGRLRRVFDLQKSLGIESHWLSRTEALALEPHLNPRLAGGIFAPGDHQVDNRLLVEALKHCFESAGGRLHEDAGDVAVKIRDRRAVGVEAGGVFHPADTVIAAAGAWVPLIPGLPVEARPPVRPVKGQMLALAMDPAAPILTHVLWTPKAYLTPRRDGRLIVGATTEERGFDLSITAGGMLSLLDSAWRALPGIEELPIIETWAGSRPGSRDDAPILGRTDIEGLILACGHHRNGILLTPITAQAIANLVLTGDIDASIADFGMARFTGIPERTERWKFA
jgi:glycine oxidase